MKGNSIYLIFIFFLVQNCTTTREKPHFRHDIFQLNSQNNASDSGEIQSESELPLQMYLGNPTDANDSLDSSDNYLIQKNQYILSYSKSRGTANWVSWYISDEWLGESDRQNNFRADNSLPSDWYHVKPKDYSKSGFDKGHICPSGDRTKSDEDNSVTFLMTNMIPQAPNNNRQTWKNLESYTRKLVDQGNEVFVIAGAYGKGGTGGNGSSDFLAGGKIIVPERIWKVILVLPKGENDLERINRETRVIAVDTPNINSINKDWTKYRVNVDSIENAAGVDVFSKIPAEIQDAIEAKLDSVNIK